MQKLDLGRGTAFWGFDRFKSDVLVQLLNDLSDLEGAGLPDEHCQHIKLALAKLTNLTTAIPDGTFLKKGLWVDFQKLETLYTEWNDYKGLNPVEYRKGKLQDLRKQRHLIAQKARKNHHILTQELDLQLVNSVYEALADLAKALPDILKNLSRAISRYKSREEDVRNRNRSRNSKAVRHT